MKTDYFDDLLPDFVTPVTPSKKERVTNVKPGKPSNHARFSGALPSLPLSPPQTRNPERAAKTRTPETIKSKLMTACEGRPISPDQAMDYLSEDDMTDLKNGALTLDQLKVYISAVVERRTRDAGQVPEHYTSVTHCRGCGPVWIFEGCPPEVWGCPWCWNRLKGRPVPSGKRDELYADGSTVN